MDLNNITVDDLKEKFSAIDKKTLIKFGIGFGAIILFLIIYYAILSPMVDEKKAKFEDKLLKQQEIQQFENDIITIKSRIKKLEPIVAKNSTLFHSRAEVEGLYQTLSEYAAMNNLVISKIEKKEIKEVTQAAALAKATGKKERKKKKKKKNAKKAAKNIAYYTIPVQFQIDGSFLGYIKFKRQVSLSQKMLNFDKESIKVVKGMDSTGAISVTGTLTIVGLADDF